MRVLVPESRRAEFEADLSSMVPAEPLWYSADLRVKPAEMGRCRQVWVVNADRLPMVDWPAASRSVRSVGDQVVLFGASSPASSACYAESVAVSEDGEVVDIRRHYDDSASFAELGSDELSFLVTSRERAAGVVAHVLVRGWSLESVGAMTRRFQVRWSEVDGVMSEGPDSPATADPVPDHMRAADGNGGSGGLELGVHAALAETERQDPIDTRATAALYVDWGRAPAGGRMYRFAKRALDVLASGGGLLILSPLLLAVAVLVKWTSPGPVFFRHRRQGLNGREFECLKFRSMRDGADAMQAQLRAQNEVDGPQFKIARDPRLSPIGSFLRESNLDELPQLFNVFLGQMSLVGPRPSPDHENQYCPAWRRTRLSVKPGITGLWQVLRSRKYPETDFQQWIYYDVAYARHRSFLLDLQILLYTPLSMLSARLVRGFAARLERRGVCSPVTRLRSANSFRS